MIETIASRFRQMAEAGPDRVALQYREREIKYSLLNHKANVIANALIRLYGDGPGRILLLCEDPLENIASQVGILKAGKTIVPVDIAFPQKRIKQILDDSRAEGIATEKKHANRANELAALVLAVDELDATILPIEADAQVRPEDVAYILYTSGTTGRPKGVIQNHRNLLHIADVYNQALGIEQADRVTTPTSLAYTGTIWALLATLCNGATFVCSTFDSSDRFLESLTTGKVTVAQMIVTILRQFMTTVDRPLQVPDLRLVYTGGETLHQQDVKIFSELFPPHCELLYNFGSTEAGIITHLKIDLPQARTGVFQQNAADPVFPAGHVVEGHQVLLMNEDACPVKTGMDGEIAVVSDYLSPGYWNDPELNEKRFLALLDEKQPLFLTGDVGRFNANGHLLHLGRKDHQIKIRGYRVQLEEVESALRSIPGIEQVAVRAVNAPQGNVRIVAYVQQKKSYDLSPVTLRQMAGEILPIYMVPTLFVFMDRMPVTAGGKLLRDKLPVPDFSRPELKLPFPHPRTKTEEMLCAIACELLQIESVGIRDNLFDLGADSFTVFRLISRIKTSMNAEVEPHTIFQAPIIEDLARNLDERNARSTQ